MDIPMGAINPAKADPAALEFLLTRRSRPAKTLALPVPDRAALQPILTAGLRTPDHGKLEPWRFLVLQRSALERLGRAARDGASAQHGADPDKAAKQFEDSHLCVAVIAVPKDSPKVPEIEQTLSAGAACYGVLMAALAAGWGANWLSGWAAHDADFAKQHLKLAPGEWVAGFIHIGTEAIVPTDRPRPDQDVVVSWIDV
ncbi:nitroreductase [Thioclava sp. SK-1]|uniref:nitroreductase family protein n=1 Tax=Thioclava sp. SK-1 TaxID=1889770 RepID=UPI0008243096|nr:nitroreductase [Thioclava sp. SK-1]OCX66923.1 nitroreductase [Thioclava sp. SK-1]